MDNTSRIRMEIGIQAQQIVSEIMINNESIAKQLKEGVELGISQFSAEDSFVQAIADATKQELNKILRESILSWEMRDKISKSFTDKIQLKVDEYAEDFAKKVIEGLK